MMIDKRSTVERRRSPLLERPSRQRRPLLSSNTSRGDGGGISSAARSSLFVNAPVQQPFVGSIASVVSVVDSLSSSRAVDGGNIGNRRKALLNTPTKAKNQVYKTTFV